MSDTKQIFILMKHRLSAMVAMSALFGAWLFGEVDLLQMMLVAVGVFVLSGGASALNQWQEHKFDALMPRTQQRPIPSGAISPQKGLLYAIAFIVLGAGLLAFTGWMPMVLGLLNIVFYNAMYTRLKRVTTFAVFPGGLVGAIPPLIGWTAMGGNVFDMQIVYFATFIFLWQVPHFWLLIIKYGKEYEAAGFSSISAKYSDVQIKTLVFTWVLISSLFLLSFPFFGVEMSVGMMVIFFILNIVFIGAFCYLLFNPSLKFGLRNAFILINSFALVVMLYLVVNANLIG